MQDFDLYCNFDSIVVQLFLVIGKGFEFFWICFCLKAFLSDAVSYESRSIRVEIKAYKCLFSMLVCDKNSSWLQVAIDAFSRCYCGF